MAISHSDINELRAVALFLKSESIASTFDGTVEVTDGMSAHSGAMVVMVLHSDSNTFNRLTILGIVNKAVHAVKAFLDIGEHGIVVVIPKVG